VGGAGPAPAPQGPYQIWGPQSGHPPTRQGGAWQAGSGWAGGAAEGPGGGQYSGGGQHPQGQQGPQTMAPFKVPSNAQPSQAPGGHEHWRGPAGNFSGPSLGPDSLAFGPPGTGPQSLPPGGPSGQHGGPGWGQQQHQRGAPNGYSSRSGPYGGPGNALEHPPLEGAAGRQDDQKRWSYDAARDGGFAEKTGAPQGGRPSTGGGGPHGPALGAPGEGGGYGGGGRLPYGGGGGPEGGKPPGGSEQLGAGRPPSGSAPPLGGGMLGRSGPSGQGPPFDGSAPPNAGRPPVGVGPPGGGGFKGPPGPGEAPPHGPGPMAGVGPPVRGRGPSGAEDHIAGGPNMWQQGADMGASGQGPLEHQANDSGGSWQGGKQSWGGPGFARGGPTQDVPPGISEAPAPGREGWNGPPGGAQQGPPGGPPPTKTWEGTLPQGGRGMPGGPPQMRPADPSGSIPNAARPMLPNTMYPPPARQGPFGGHAVGPDAEHGQAQLHSGGPNNSMQLPGPPPASQGWPATNALPGGGFGSALFSEGPGDAGPPGIGLPGVAAAAVAAATTGPTPPLLAPSGRQVLPKWRTEKGEESTSTKQVQVGADGRRVPPPPMEIDPLKGYPPKPKQADPPPEQPQQNTQPPPIWPPPPPNNQLPSSRAGPPQSLPPSMPPGAAWYPPRKSNLAAQAKPPPPHRPPPDSLPSHPQHPPPSNAGARPSWPPPPGTGPVRGPSGVPPAAVRPPDDVGPQPQAGAAGVRGKGGPPPLARPPIGLQQAVALPPPDLARPSVMPPPQDSRGGGWGVGGPRPGPGAWGRY
jgi:hypothetical protein